MRMNKRGLDEYGSVKVQADVASSDRVGLIKMMFDALIDSLVVAQAKIERVAATLLSSPFLIPQDLLALDGITVQRAAAGLNLTQGAHRARLVFAVENLTDKYYREQFQFAPSRGRTFTVGLSLGAF